MWQNITPVIPFFNESVSQLRQTFDVMIKVYLEELSCFCRCCKELRSRFAEDEIYKRLAKDADE